MDKKRITTLEDFGDIQIRNLGTEVVDEKAIREAVTPFSNLVPGATQEEIEKAIKNLQTRYFIQMDGGYIWGDTKEELIEKYRTPTFEPKPISFSFISALIYDFN